MMNRIKSAKINLFRFLFVLPLLAVLTIAFRSKQVPIHDTSAEQDLKIDLGDMNVSATVRAQAFHSNTPAGASYKKQDIVIQKKASLEPSRDTVPNGYTEVKTFINRNPSVKRVFWKDNPASIGIEFKDGKVEVYKLDDKDEMANAESKYGKLPIASPAPPSKSFSLQLKAEYDNESFELIADTVTLFEDKKILEFKGEVVILQNNNRIKLRSNSIKLDLVNNIVICDSTIELKTDTLVKKADTSELQKN